MDEIYNDENSFHSGNLYFSSVLDALLIHPSALQPFEEVIITIILRMRNKVTNPLFASDWRVSQALDSKYSPWGSPRQPGAVGHPRGNQGSQCHKSRIEYELMPKISWCLHLSLSTLPQFLKILNLAVRGHILSVNINMKTTLSPKSSSFHALSPVKLCTAAVWTTNTYLSSSWSLTQEKHVYLVNLLCFSGVHL